MEKFEKEYIKVIRAAMTGKAEVLSADFDWEKAIETAKMHNIVPILFYGALNCNVPRDSEPMQILHRQTLQNLMTSVRQQQELEQLQAVFEQQKIHHMPLKGAILKDLYPKPEMRTMGDADVLIKMEQYPQIEKIVAELGYQFQYESDHELIWQKPTLYLELHKRIMSTHNKDFYSYFGSGWDIAKPVADSFRYEMSAEDFYLYIFVHFTKHYRISGIGIKHVLDLWVYTNAHPELNWEYILNELSKMGLRDFHENVSKTIDVWFKDEKATEATELITLVVLSCGQYGCEEITIVNHALQKGKKTALSIKMGALRKSIFLPYSAMKVKYAILEKAPILLPIMWVVRWFDVLFRKNARLKNYLDKVNRIDDDEVNTRKYALEAVGLSFEHED